MTISQQTWQKARSNPNPVSVALTNVVTAGSLVVCVCAITSTSTITVTDDFGDGVSWTQFLGPFSETNAGADLFLFYKVVGTPSGAGTKKTVTCTGSTTGNLSMAIDEYLSDVAVTWATDGSNNAGTTTSTNPSPGAITTTGTGLVIGAEMDSDAANAPTAGTGFTSQFYVGSGFDFWGVEDQINTASGTYTASWTKPSCTWRAFAAAFKATASGGALRRNSSLNGLGSSGPFFHDPLA